MQIMQAKFLPSPQPPAPSSRLPPRALFPRSFRGTHGRLLGCGASCWASPGLPGASTMMPVFLMSAQVGCVCCMSACHVFVDGGCHVNMSTSPGCWQRCEWLLACAKCQLFITSTVPSSGARTKTAVWQQTPCTGRALYGRHARGRVSHSVLRLRKEAQPRILRMCVRSHPQ